MMKELFKFGTSVRLNRMEIPTKVKLCSEEWTTTNTLVTPALKIRRKNIQKFYELDIDRIYGKEK
jgi:long-chain acyl-CoA synthetase